MISLRYNFALTHRPSEDHIFKHRTQLQKILIGRIEAGIMEMSKTKNLTMAQKVYDKLIELDARDDQIFAREGSFTLKFARNLSNNCTPVNRQCSYTTLFICFRQFRKLLPQRAERIKFQQKMKQKLKARAFMELRIIVEKSVAYTQSYYQ